jgi:hypothetical protein
LCERSLEIRPGSRVPRVDPQSAAECLCGGAELARVHERHPKIVMRYSETWVRPDCFPECLHRITRVACSGRGDSDLDVKSCLVAPRRLVIRLKRQSLIEVSQGDSEVPFASLASPLLNEGREQMRTRTCHRWVELEGPTKVRCRLTVPSQADERGGEQVVS